MRMNMMLLAVNSSMILFGTPVIFSPLPDVDAYENKTITLQCQAIGDAVISIAWLHNDTLVQNRSVNTALVISKIPLNMSGSWRCVASNHLGSQNKTFFVGVKKPSDLCVRFNTLSDATRFHSYKTTSTAQSDAFLNRTDWYAFKSPTGYYQLLTSCAPANRCNAVATGWLRGKHPTTADGVVTRTVCFHRNGDCCHSSVKVQVRNCVNQYVYKLVPPDEPLTARYCTEDHVEGDSDDVTLMTIKSQIHLEMHLTTNAKASTGVERISSHEQGGVPTPLDKRHSKEAKLTHTHERVHDYHISLLEMAKVGGLSRTSKFAEMGGALSCNSFGECLQLSAQVAQNHYF
ncbi:predicted protein [Nematostella vectensis]|uniref:Ig-like domain-containing protein n=1 Tax=Nematostella vectensis TaxID=45351 RepID=A7SKR5_NEMVE|nr:predicted protein [Nematostella vectensis]|eukprot:XP_001627784.1 predicted protein [Nematostella vectensis]